MKQIYKTSYETKTAKLFLRRDDTVVPLMHRVSALLAETKY